MKTGIEAQFRAVNDAGGVHRRRLRLVALDDGYEPKRAAENMRKLIDEYHVFGFIGNVGTPTAMAALPVAVDAHRLFFGAYTGGRLLRKTPPDRYVFNYRPGYDDETAAIVHYLLSVRNLKPEQIAVFAQKDGYGDDGYHGVERALRKLKLPAKIMRVGYERNHADVKEAVKTILAVRDRIKAVVMVATYEPAARFIQALRDVGMDDTIFTNVSFVGSNVLAEKLHEMGPRYCKGVIVTQVVPLYDSGATGVIRYRDHLKKYFPDESPGFVSLEGYIAAAILVEGLKKAGPKLTTDSLIEGLESIRDLDLGIGPLIRFGASLHQGSTKVWGTQLNEKGEYQELELE
jgi:ABC-type branched-subunit amino acid transport system substrate-binding protein